MLKFSKKSIILPTAVLGFSLIIAAGLVILNQAQATPAVASSLSDLEIYQGCHGEPAEGDCVKADFNGDGQVNAPDFALFAYAIITHDLNGDEIVNIATTTIITASDYDVWLACSGKPAEGDCAKADFDGDGTVWIQDFNELRKTMDTYDLNGDGIINKDQTHLTDYDVFGLCWWQNTADTPDCAKADFDEDGFVGPNDYTMFGDALGKYDLNGDGIVNFEQNAFSDYDSFQECWGKKTTDDPDCANRDFDEDGVIGFNDYNLFGNVFNIYDLNGDGIINYPFPDLIITGAEHQLTSQTINGVDYDVINFIVKYKNDSTVDLNQNFYFGIETGSTDEYPTGGFKSSISLDSIVNSSDYLSSLYTEAGQEYTISIGGYLLPKGKDLNTAFKLLIDKDPFSADNSNLIREDDEDNNTLTKAVTIEGDANNILIDISVNNNNMQANGTASMYWNTNIEATCDLIYSQSSNLSNSTTVAGNIVQYPLPSNDNRAHYYVQLTNLNTSNTYYYKVNCETGNQSKESPVLTLISINEIVISNVNVSNIMDDSAKITWTTNFNSNTWVNYGKTTSYGLSKEVDSQSSVKEHSAILNYLEPNTKYYFQVSSRDELSDGSATTKTGKFRTQTSEAEAPTCADSDGGKKYYKKGTAKGIAYWGKSLNMVQEFGDYCAGGNLINELYCGDDGYVHQGNYECEHGCYLGACCGPEGCNGDTTEQCTDSDGGENYKEAGEVSVIKYNNLLKYNDKCVQLAPTQDGTNFYAQDGEHYYSSINNCSGDGCYIAEAYCSGERENFKIIPCSSCSAGACSSYNEPKDNDHLIEVELSDDHKDVKLNKIFHKAFRLFHNKLGDLLSELKELRDIVKEQQTQIKYLASLKKDMKQLSETVENAINNFITYGVDDNTKKLGAGERAAVMYSFKAAFKKLPETEDELADAIKIANGRWPSSRSEESEKAAKNRFEKIYKKIANMDNPNDNAAITVMAYGLRQKAENRNLDSEKRGIEIFRNIYNRLPESTEDWNITQAITYSGASRGVDSDGDLLLDEREVELGTDPNNPDTDGDGYIDGAEVANGFNPLGN